MLSREQNILISILNVDYLKAGNEIRINCPFCGNDNKKMYFSSKGMYHCFVCGESGGSLLSFLSKYYGESPIEVKIRLKQEHIANYGYRNIFTGNEQDIANGIIADLISSSESNNQLKMIPLPSNTKKLIDNYNNPESYPFFAYLKRRGVTRDQLKHFDIRYVISGAAPLKTGKTLYIRNSLVFVTYYKGNPVYWNTRSIEQNPNIKSFNASGDSSKYYSKKNSVFNIDSLNVNSMAVICEGIFNALTVDATKLLNVVPLATFGKQITDEQLQLIISKNPRYYFLYLDSDAFSTELKLANRLINFGISPNKIRLVTSPYGNKDANDLGSKIVTRLIKSASQVTQDGLKQKQILSNLQ